MAEHQSTGSLAEDLAVQFESQENCDALFQVAGNTIGVHKFLLQARNRVLFDMVSSWAIGEEPIAINNIDYESFKAVIRYIYTDEISLSKENVFIFLYASTHFKMPRLEKMCVDQIGNFMGTGNVCVMMEEAVNFDSPVLQRKCQDLFSKETYKVLKEEAFQHLSQPALSAFLDTESTNVLEIKLFSECKAWMAQKCSVLQLPVNGTNMREVIGNALYKIRFPTMIVQDFANSVSMIKGLLTGPEMAEIFQAITVFDNKKVQCQFPTEFRCQSSSYNRPFDDMIQLCLSKVHYSYVHKQYCDLNSMADTDMDISDGEAMRVTSLRLILQCCADLTNSSMRYKYASPRNQEIRHELFDDLTTWQDLANTRNIRDMMTKFAEIRSKVDKLCAWG